jgi:cell division protein FtsN
VAAKPLALLVAPKPAESQPAASPPPKPALPQPAAPKPPPVTERAPDPLLRQAILDTKAGRAASVLVQLGAFGSRDSALTGWSKIVAASGEALAGLSPAVVEVTLPGKGRLWRLRTAVADKAAAQALCAKLTSHGQACLLVRD